MENGFHFDREQISRLCQRYQVRRLAVFGSALRRDFNTASSDVDVVVEFEPLPVAVRMQNYLELRDGLSQLFGRRVDLIEEGAIRNPYILRRMEEEQQLLYAA